MHALPSRNQYNLTFLAYGFNTPFYVGSTLGRFAAGSECVRFLRWVQGVLYLIWNAALFCVNRLLALH